MIVEPTTAPSQITIPNYGPSMNPDASTADMSELGSSSMMSGGGYFGGAPASPGGMGESLLGAQPDNNSQPYSMTEYFQTFVMDVYGLFRSLPVYAQVPLVIFLIFLVIKLI